MKNTFERKLHPTHFNTSVLLTGFKAVDISNVGTAIAPRIAVLVTIATSIGRIARRPIAATAYQKIHTEWSWLYSIQQTT